MRARPTIMAMTVVFTSMGCIPFAASAADPAGRYETPPVLHARDLAPKVPLSGPGYTVDDRVPTDGLMGRFTIRSGDRRFEALGAETLATRVREVRAILELEKTSKTDVFVKAAGKAAKRPVDAAVNIVQNPVDTVKGLPGGVSRFFDRVGTGAKNLAEPKTDEGRSAAQSAGKVSANALGYEQERRQLAKQLGVDPYTTNEVLAKKLDDIAWVAFSGRLGVNVLVSVAVPGSMIISGTTMINNLVWDTPQGDLVNLVNSKLDEMGVAEEQKRSFTGNRHIPLSVQTAIVTNLSRLSNVPGRPDVISLAASVQSGEQASFVARAVTMLVQNQKKYPLASLSVKGTVVARDKRGTIVVPAPVDYVSWTERVARFARRDDLKVKDREIWLGGRVSLRARKQLEALGWKIKEEML
jgi:hypothetical protein